MRLKHNEKKALKMLNHKKKAEDRLVIRFPYTEGNGCIKTTAMKVNWCVAEGQPALLAAVAVELGWGGEKGLCRSRP